MKPSLPEAISNFMDSCGREYEFPTGGRVAILTPQESDLFEALGDADTSAYEYLRAISTERDWTDCYSIAIFGVRLAILGVRTANQRAYRLGLIAFLAGGSKLDWRDALGALAVFEDCGKRLGIGLRPEIESMSFPGVDNRLQPVLDGYFGREERMRRVDVMGMKQIGDADEFTFAAITAI